MKRYKFIITLVVNLILVLVVLGFSFTQTLNRKSSNAIGNLDTCNKSNGIDLVPIRLKNGSIFFMCAWAPKYSAIRILIGFAGIILLSLLISFLYKNRKFSFLIVSFVTMACGGFELYSTVIDGMQLVKSKKYCENTVVKEQEDGTECDFKYFYGTIVFNMVTGLYLIVLSIVALKHRSGLFKVHAENEALIKKDANNEVTPESNNSFNSNSYASGSV